MLIEEIERILPDRIQRECLQTLVKLNLGNRGLQQYFPGECTKTMSS